MYNPGSFTKNVGWQTGNQKGLQSLHTAIRDGFEAERSNILRVDFRDNCAADKDRQLVFLNFFLHNTLTTHNRNLVTFDQLVRKALLSPHSWNFDQLALFALNLAEMGDRTGKAGSSEGARFARDYVRDVLWQGGGWQRSNLTEYAIERAFSGTVRAQTQDTVRKCATNYYFILSSAGLLEGEDPIINNQYGRWCKDALYLFFDRVADHATDYTEPDLLQLVKSYEVHKLLGTNIIDLMYLAPSIAAAYINEGGITRPFLGSSSATTPLPQQTPSGAGANSSAAAPTATGESDDTEDLLYVRRQVREIEAQIRNPKNVRELKALYANECAFCGKQTIGGLDPTTFYSEAAHIQPVGTPHNGADTKSNMILLCSEHHLQFDRGLHTIAVKDGSYYVESKILNSPIAGKPIVIKSPHTLNDDHINYHRKLWHFA